MTDIKRTVKCSNCGVEATVTINSELEMSELILAGRCNRCGNSMQINYNVVEKTASTTAPASSTSSSDVVNIDESLFTPDLPSDAIRDLMEE